MRFFNAFVFFHPFHEVPNLNKKTPRNLIKDVSHLAVVSGGAYTAACYVTHLLKASDMTPPQLGSQVEPRLFGVGIEWWVGGMVESSQDL